ncbi:hypothetical protein [Leifsonia sp. AG29]|uniref:hypothetical protein n=1 Tax=Leifsonia sp. AG29 TaxID=2598860 RepID=UPI00131CDDF9|nr:hypothetical protein [Leifsonia sp. AG29]
MGHSLKAVSRATAGGFPICAPSEVWVQLSGVVGPEDLVAAGDHLVGARRRPALATVAELATASERCSHSKGARSREWALSRIRWGADSRPESLLRLLLGDLGLEGLEVNPPVVVGDGTVTLHPDLTLPDRRLAFEYEGDGHRADARQWRLDIERRELLEERGWRVVRVTASDLFGDRAPFLRRLGRFVPNVA